MTVRSRAGKGALHKDERPPRPSLTYALPAAEAQHQGSPEPAQTVSEEAGGASGRHIEVNVRDADPRAVADRVYQLMLQEIKQGRERGETPYRG